MCPKKAQGLQSLEKELIQEIRYLNKTLSECEKEVLKLKAGHKKLEDSFRAYQEEKGFLDLSKIRGD